MASLRTGKKRFGISDLLISFLSPILKLFLKGHQNFKQPGQHNQRQRIFFLAPRLYFLTPRKWFLAPRKHLMVGLEHTFGHQEKPPGAKEMLPGTHITLPGIQEKLAGTQKKTPSPQKKLWYKGYIYIFTLKAVKIIWSIKVPAQSFFFFLQYISSSLFKHASQNQHWKYNHKTCIVMFSRPAPCLHWWDKAGTPTIRRSKLWSS